MSAPDHMQENKSDRGTFGETVSENLKTSGVQNMEAAWSRAGASAHHTPGGATRLGSQDQLGSNESESGSGTRIESKGLTELVGEKKFTTSVPRGVPGEQPSMIGNMVNDLLNGSK